MKIYLIKAYYIECDKCNHSDEFSHKAVTRGKAINYFIENGWHINDNITICYDCYVCDISFCDRPKDVALYVCREHHEEDLARAKAVRS